MHSCFEVNDSATVVIDPHDGRSIGVKPPSLRADIVLISHDHFDHNAVRVVKGDYVVVKDVTPRKIRDVEIRGISAFHDNAEGEKRGRVNLFQFTMDGVRFCHLGDLGHMLTEKQKEELGPVDVLFIPVGGVFTINGAQAQQLVKAIAPKVAIPMHFRVGGLSLSIHNAEEFLHGIPEDRVVRVGNEVEFEIGELPEETEYWVFSQ
jgi:L-ascorbate metabolism protein UlaG (beta-lactamase superfamily)